MFIEAPQPKLTNSTNVVVEIERPPQTDIGEKTGPTTTTSTLLEFLPLHPHITGKVYVSSEPIQALVQI